MFKVEINERDGDKEMTNKTRSEAAETAWARRKLEATKKTVERLGQAQDESLQRLWEENLELSNKTAPQVDEEELASLLDDLGL
jgi:hypothetical protein